MNKPSVILLGSKPGAVVALSLLLERGWDIRYVIVSKEHEYDWIPKPSLRDFALENSLSVLESQHEIPKDSNVNFVISYMCRDLVKPRTLSMAITAALNFHAGPLPDFGGWAFYNVAILEDSQEYGCTCHHMDNNFDTGPLLKVSRFSIEPDKETALSLEMKAQEDMIKLFREFCELAELGIPLPKFIQDESKMRYMKRVEFEKLKEIPIDSTAEEIEKIARAFWYPPYTCAYMNIGNNKVEIIPELAKKHIAKDLHSNDLQKLYVAAGLKTNIQRDK